MILQNIKEDKWRKTGRADWTKEVSEGRRGWITKSKESVFWGRDGEFFGKLEEHKNQAMELRLPFSDVFNYYICSFQVFWNFILEYEAQTVNTDLCFDWGWNSIG